MPNRRVLGSWPQPNEQTLPPARRAICQSGHPSKRNAVTIQEDGARQVCSAINVTKNDGESTKSHSQRLNPPPFGLLRRCYPTSFRKNNILLRPTFSSIILCNQEAKLIPSHQEVGKLSAQQVYDNELEQNRRTLRSWRLRSVVGGDWSKAKIRLTRCRLHRGLPQVAKTALYPLYSLPLHP